MSKATNAHAGSRDQDVADYLREHPDFFAGHPELLSTLIIPHPTGRATSLVERQLTVLREQNGELDKRLHDLVAVARENDQLSERMHQLAMALIGVRSLQQVLTVVRESMIKEFGADLAVLRIGYRPAPETLEAPEGDESFVSPEDPGLKLFEDLFKSGRPKCGRIQSAQGHFLFADESEQVGSAALIPLSGKNWRGLLAVGSGETDRFQPGMGTLFLGRMGKLVSGALEPHLSPDQ
jgi:uncharacterized protein YigA (DUF484 family)